MPLLDTATQVETEGISKTEDKVCGAQAMVRLYNKTAQKMR